MANPASPATVALRPPDPRCWIYDVVRNWVIKE